MSKEKPKILLGFDFGMKRIGMAVGQTITQTARALDTLRAKEGIPAWDALAKIISRWSPDALVVGIPYNMDGTTQPMTQHAKQFAHALRDRFRLPVYEMDERLTTKEAREKLFSEGGYKALLDGQVDCIAAQLILQNWMLENIKK